jgi:DNA-directed RNA polymerase specialized sigma24 family protein
VAIAGGSGPIAQQVHGMSAKSSSPADFHASDYELAQDLLDGSDDAWRLFHRELQPAVMLKLRAIGASPADADEVLGLLIDKLWTQRKLAAYTGSGPLVAFVKTAAANTWLEYLRKHRRMVTATTLQGGTEVEGESTFEAITPATPASETEVPLALLLKNALLHALLRTDAEALLILRLSILQGIKQRELCTLWGGCHEGTISHKKQQAVEQIRDLTMQAVREREPDLKVTWQDIMEACGEGVEAILGPVEG